MPGRHADAAGADAGGADVADGDALLLEQAPTRIMTTTATAAVVR